MTSTIKPLPGIVGLTGPAGCGKDALAKILCKTAGYVRYALADPIKEELNRLFLWNPGQWEDREWKENYLEGGRTPRQWAQWLGARIRQVDPDWWLDSLFERAFDDGNLSRMVITDVRYNNEAQVITAMGGVILGLRRKAIKPVAAHESERGVAPTLVHMYLDNIEGDLSRTAVDALRQLAAWEEVIRSLPDPECRRPTL